MDGETRIHRSRSDGQPDGESAAQQGSHRDRLQPHALQSAVAGRKGNAMGGLAACSRQCVGLHLRHGHQLRRDPGDHRRSRRLAGRPEPGKNFHRHEHRQSRSEPCARSQSPRPGRRHGRFAGLRQRHHPHRRQAVSDGRRAQGDVRKGQAAAARHRPESHATSATTAWRSP